jgi:hypothetical protein
MQKQTFTNGGFVLHKVQTFNMTSFMSVWADASGNVLDIERRDGRKPTGLDKAKAERLAGIWKAKDNG